MNNNNWSKNRIIMFSLTIVLIITRILDMIYWSRLGATVFYKQFILLFEILFFLILFFIPKKFRVIGVLPLFMLILINGWNAFQFIQSSYFSFLLMDFAFRSLVTRILYILMYLAFIVLLLPFITYNRNHIRFAKMIMIPFIIDFVIIFLLSLHFLDNWHTVRGLIFNFIVFFTVPTIFTIYIIEEFKKRINLMINSVLINHS